MTETMNPFHSSVKQCPYPFYDRVRESGPVEWSDEIDAWLVTSYDDVMAVLKDNETYSSTNSVFGGPELEHPEFPSMINADEPRHRKLRALAAKAFTPRALDADWEPRIRQITDELLDRIEAQGRFDGVTDLAAPLPVRMIAEVIGVDADHGDDFKRWSDEIANIIGRYDAVRAAEAEGYEIEEPSDMGPLFVYFMQTIADRRMNPQDDLVTRLVEAEVDGEKLTDFETVAFLVLLLVAGNETTTTAITTSMRILAEEPGHMEALYEHPEQIDGFIEEALRWDAPIHSFYRRATRDTELHGKSIKAGEALLVVYAAANRDPAEFGCPEEFDRERGRRDHASFGIGVHYCLGANLARLEARTAIAGLVGRFAKLETEPGYVEAFRDTPFFGGVTQLPLRFVRRGAAGE